MKKNNLYNRVTEADEFAHSITQARKNKNRKLLRTDSNSTVWIRWDTEPDGILDGESNTARDDQLPLGEGMHEPATDRGNMVPFGTTPDSRGPEK